MPHVVVLITGIISLGILVKLIPRTGVASPSPPYGFQKREKLEDFEYFPYVGVIEISFSFTLNKEMHALRGLLL